MDARREISGAFRRLFGGESRSTLANPAEWLVEALAGGPTFAGKSVSPSTSMELVPVWSAVSLLAGAVASLPLVVYRRIDDDERERASGTRQWELLHNNPNEEMAADELWEIVMAHLLLWGNAFLWKVRGGDGRIAELWPISPTRVQVGRRSGRKVIVIDGNPYSELQILHIRGLGMNGLVGLSPIQQARQMLGSALAQEEFQGTFWANGTLLSGFLMHPQELSDQALSRLERMWKTKWSGVRNAGKTPILEEGMKYETATMPLADAQFIEQAKYGDLRVAQLFRVPPYMLGAEIGSSLTYSTTESQGIDFVRYSLGRWLRRIEKSLERDVEIFPPSLSLYSEFLVDALLRSDTKTRYQVGRLGVRNQLLLPNEWRRGENMPPLPGGDKFPSFDETTPDVEDKEDDAEGKSEGGLR